MSRDSGKQCCELDINQLPISATENRCISAVPNTCLSKQTGQRIRLTLAVDPIQEGGSDEQFAGNLPMVGAGTGVVWSMSRGAEARTTGDIGGSYILQRNIPGPESGRGQYRSGFTRVRPASEKDSSKQGRRLALTRKCDALFHSRCASNRILCSEYTGASLYRASLLE